MCSTNKQKPTPAANKGAYEEDQVKWKWKFKKKNNKNKKEEEPGSKDGENANQD